MLRKICRFLILLIVATSCNENQAEKDAQERATIGHIEIYDQTALQVLDTAQKVEILAEGFEWSEGPLWLEELETLIFSDVPMNKIYAWTEPDSLSVYLEPSGYTGTMTGTYEKGSNGLALDADNNLILCQHGDRRLAKMESSFSKPQSNFTSLSETFEGKRFNSPNDLAIAQNGDIYFTDPPYGLDKGEQDSLKELDFQGVFRYRPNGELDLLAKNLSRPNGLALSRDERRLYVANSDPSNIKWQVYDLDETGLSMGDTIFFDGNNFSDLPGLPDGLKVGENGHIFATGPGGVFLFSSQGKLLARIFTEKRTSNCAFDHNFSHLFMTADDYLLRLKLK